MRAAQREMLKEMRCNGLRMLDDAPARELLDLTGKMSFLLIDEIFDCLEPKKHYLIFICFP